MNKAAIPLRRERRRFLAVYLLKTTLVLRACRRLCNRTGRTRASDILLRLKAPEGRGFTALLAKAHPLDMQTFLVRFFHALVRLVVFSPTIRQPSY